MNKNTKQKFSTYKMCDYCSTIYSIEETFNCCGENHFTTSSETFEETCSICNDSFNSWDLRPTLTKNGTALACEKCIQEKNALYEQMEMDTMGFY